MRSRPWIHAPHPGPFNKSLSWDFPHGVNFIGRSQEMEQGWSSWGQLGLPSPGSWMRLPLRAGCFPGTCISGYSCNQAKAHTLLLSWLYLVCTPPCSDGCITSKFNYLCLLDQPPCLGVKTLNPSRPSMSVWSRNPNFLHPQCQPEAARLLWYPSSK